MGTDVQLYALVDPTPAELFAANEYWGKHVPGAIFDEFKPRNEQLFYEGLDREVQDYVKPSIPMWPRVEVHTLQRYSSPGYRMWAWPSSFQAIKLLEVCFPNAVICYGGDGHWWSSPVTEEFIAEMWEAYFDDPDMQYCTSCEHKFMYGPGKDCRNMDHLKHHNPNVKI